MQSNKVLVIFVILLPVICASGCLGIEELAETIKQFLPGYNKAVGVFDRAISDLDKDSEDWKIIVERLQKDLPSTVQSTIRTEVQSTLNRAIMASGVQFDCQADFLRERVRQDLIRIRAELTGMQVDPRKPVYCTSDPKFINMYDSPDRRSHILITGYDFDVTPRPKAFLVGPQIGELDVSKYLSITSHYEMVLDISGGGIPKEFQGIIPEDIKIIIRWNGQDLSELPILIEECMEDVVSYQPNPIDLVPDHTEGDAEFNTNGPFIFTRIQLFINNNAVMARCYVRAQETNGGDTAAEMDRIIPIYPAPHGWEILKITSPENLVEEYRYTDSDLEPETRGGGSGIAKSYTFVGDTMGDEAGTRTKVGVVFNPIKVLVRKTENCL